MSLAVGRAALWQSSRRVETTDSFELQSVRAFTRLVKENGSPQCGDPFQPSGRFAKLTRYCFERFDICLKERADSIRRISLGPSKIL